MTASRVSYLAARMLPAAKDQGLVDFLFDKADFDATGGAPSVCRGVWSTSVAAKAYRGPIAKACAVASHPGTDPEILAKFAKDTRVSVRHCLLANQATPYETVVSLVPWALGRQDSLALDSIVSRLTPDDVASLLESMTSEARSKLRLSRGGFMPVRGIAEKALESPDVCLRVARQSWYALSEFMARRLVRAASPPVSLSEFIEALPEDDRNSVLVRVFDSASVLTAEMVALAAKYPGSFNRPEVGDSVVLVEPDALEPLAQLGPRNMEFALANGLSGAAVSRLVEHASALDMVTVVESMSSRRYSVSVEKQIAKRLIATGGDLSDALLDVRRGAAYGSAPVAVFLRHAGFALSDDLLVSLLRNGSAASTMSWLGHCTSAAPNGAARPQVLAKVIADPGNAFTAPERSLSVAVGRYETVLQSYPAAPWINRALRVSDFAADVDSTTRAVLVDALDETIIAELHHAHVQPLIVPFLEEAFGSDRQQWDTFLTLASDWSGGFLDLVDATAALSGVPLRAVSPPPADAAPVVPDSCSALSLVDMPAL